ncbi:integrase family protein [Candidatus Nitrosarchaeum limnium SFB1]|jgi:integrase|uniref:Integrase family protein n=1 Tax=Candidatus Nitrosarchaeum limnium SFB1 TaxID=886738 RepID=F3KMS4_9ARCH|nr:integrase family protein [Candidatus Nitrosarchaeum limnium SFB1]
MSFLTKIKNVQTYLDSLKVRSPHTIQGVKYSLIKFEKFVENKYKGKNLEDILDELNRLDKSNQETALIDLLQDFVNYLDGIGMHPSTMKGYFSTAKRYLRYRGFKIYNEDISQNIILPRVVEEEKHPLTKEEIKKILDNSSVKRKTLYLTLLSSGMRIGECVSLRKRDFDVITHDRIAINIPGKFTKTKKPRTTFVSNEAAEYLKVILSKIKDDDLVFTKNPISDKAKLTEEVTFDRIRKKTNLTEKYDSKTHKISLQSFRAFFITKCNRVDFGVGHALAGHSLYMKRYDRLTLEEKLEYYKKAEPELCIYRDSTLTKQQSNEIDDLKANLAELTKRYEIDTARKDEEISELSHDLNVVTRFFDEYYNLNDVAMKINNDLSTKSR